MTDPLDAAMDEAIRRYVERNPNSARLASEAAEVMPGGNTRSVLHTDPFGVRIEHAEGGVLTTVDGEQVVDLLLDLNQIGQTLILVTHDEDLARQCATRLIEVADGSIVRDESVGRA